MNAIQMEPNEYGHPVFELQTKHGNLIVTVNDKTPEKDARGGEVENYPIDLRGELKIHGVDISVNASFRVYRLTHKNNELHAFASYGIKRAGPFGADATSKAREIVNGYAVEAYKMVTDEMWTQARRAELRSRVNRLLGKARELRDEATKLESQADTIAALMP